MTKAISVATAVGNGPAFSAYQSVSQNISASTFTKIQLQTELFDTNSNFDSTTNYRFTPTVAGYYQINGTLNLNASATRLIVSIFKNGTEYCRGFDVPSTTLGGSVSQIVYFNGSTDYVELYGYLLGGTIATNASQAFILFSGTLVRGA